MRDQLLTKIGDPAINPSDPWADDVFERREHGERLERLIRNTPGAFVIALKAPWGAGKSVFLRRLEAHLEATPNPIPVVRIDAWHNDFLSDPLAVLTAALSERINRNPVKGFGESAGKLAGKLAEVGAKLLPAMVSIAGAITTGVVVPVIVAAAEATKVTGEALLKREADHREAASSFKRLLSEAVDLLTKQPSDPTAKRPPLVILIDELDRCRPDFAIRMLERVKHFFDVDGCVFLVATDGGNLPAAVASQYGANVDGERYLRRFFDLEYRLPEPSAEQVGISFFLRSGLLRQEVQLRDVRDAIKDQRNPRALARDVDLVEGMEAFIELAPRLELSLRDCAQALTALSAVVRSIPADTQILPAPLVFGVLLRFAAPAKFDAVLQPGGSLSRVLGASDGPRIVRGSVGEKQPPISLLHCNHIVISHSLRLFQELGALAPGDRLDTIQSRTRDRNMAGSNPHYWSSARDRFLSLPADYSADEHVRRMLSLAGAFVPNT